MIGYGYTILASHLLQHVGHTLLKGMVDYIHLFVSVKLILYDDKFSAVRLLEKDVNITKQKMIATLAFNPMIFGLWAQHAYSAQRRR